MALLETGVWSSVGGGLIAIGITLFLLEDSKKEKIRNELDDVYWKLRNQLLDPLIEQIMTKRRRNENPHKVISTPEVSELLGRYREYLEEYINAESYKNVIASVLSYSYPTAIGTGAAVIGLSLANEFLFQNLEVLVVTFAIIGIGSFFLGLFMSQYRKYYNEYIKQISKIRRRFR